jgi:hypothetical protein
LYTYLHPPLEADEMCGESCQLVAAIHDEGDGLVLYECHSQGYDSTHSCCVCLSLAGLKIKVPFTVLCWSFLCKLRDFHVVSEIEHFVAGRADP